MRRLNIKEPFAQSGGSSAPDPLLNDARSLAVGAGSPLKRTAACADWTETFSRSRRTRRCVIPGLQGTGFAGERFPLIAAPALFVVELCSAVEDGALTRPFFETVTYDAFLASAVPMSSLALPMKRTATATAMSATRLSDGQGRLIGRRRVRPYATRNGRCGYGKNKTTAALAAPVTITNATVLTKTATRVSMRIGSTFQFTHLTTRNRPYGSPENGWLACFPSRGDDRLYLVLRSFA